MKKYESPFSKSELRYFQTLMQNDTKAEGRGATYAKLEILLKEDLKNETRPKHRTVRVLTIHYRQF